jgi:predicted acylesterase/phospholipase RssA
MNKILSRPASRILVVYLAFVANTAFAETAGSDRPSSNNAKEKLTNSKEMDQTEQEDADADPADETVIEESFVPRTAFGIPLAVIVRGGVSLGAFEAGYLYYITESIKENPGVFDIRLVTGASAGSINALLLLLALGAPPEPDPSKSIFYRIWTPLSQSKLLDTKNPSTPLGAASSGAALHRVGALVWEDWKKGFDESFEMVIGMSTTRLKPYEIEITPGFKVQRQTEKFVFIVKGRGRGRPPKIENFIHVKKGLYQPMLPFEPASKDDSKEEAAKKDRRNFDRLKNVVIASSAFPIGFPPQPIDYCMIPVTDETDGSECKESTERGLFIDGGVYDNNPLRMAHRIAAMGLHRDGDANLVRGERTDTEPYLYLYLYVDPEHYTYPSNLSAETSDAEDAEEGGKKDERDMSVFEMVPNYLSTFVSSARAAELLPLSTALMQTRFTLRAGYQFSTNGGFTASNCKGDEEDDISSSPLHCSFPLMQMHVVLSFYERVRVTLGVEWALPWFDALPPKNSHWVTLITAIGWQWLSPFKGVLD